MDDLGVPLFQKPPYYIYIYTNIYIYIYIYKHIYIYIHTYIYTYIYGYILKTISYYPLVNCYIAVETMAHLLYIYT